MPARRSVYALLVGIDEYEPPVPALAGCVNDIERVATWLGRRTEAAGDGLRLEVLRNGEARRRAVIDAFRRHLGQAGPDDVAFFYYSGHGSQERAMLPEHLEVEPDGLNETLVLVDSRHDGVYDLADKELAQLVGEVAGRAGHTLVVLDCCHSGSGVRAVVEDGVAARRAPTDDRPRPAASYLTGSGRNVAAPGPDADADWLNDAADRYLLLAACQANQTAKEVRVDGQPRGAFSVALERALSGLGSRPSYLDVQRSVAAAVRNLAAAQWPVLEAAQPSDVHQPFLGGVAAPAEPTLTASFADRRGWQLDAGRLHGLAPAAQGSVAEVTLHPLAGDADPTAVTTARITEVGTVTSALEVADPDVLDRASTYRARLVGAGQPTTSVAVIGAGGLAERIRAGLRASPVVELAPGEAAELVVTCTADEVGLTRPGALRPLAAGWNAADPAASTLAVRTCEHIGRWLGIAQRQNPATTLRSDEVRLTVHDGAGDELGAGGRAIEVFYTGDDQAGETNPTIRIRYSNNSPVPLHCSLLVLTELYGVSCLTVGGSVLLEPGDTAWGTDAAGDTLLRTFVPDDQERTTDLLKLLVSTEPFDAQALAQDDLRPPTRTRGAELRDERGIGGRPVTPTNGPDWATRDLLVTTVRPRGWRSVPDTPDRRLELGGGVTMLGHAGLSARARLAAAPTAAREAIVTLLPSALLDPDTPTEPFVFGATRAVGDELAVLELDDVKGADTVSAGTPLRLRLDQRLGAGEHVLPVAFDGEDFLPLGRVVGDGLGTEVELHRLPEQTAISTRSLGGSLKILFRKLVLGRIGVGYDHPLLSLVTFRDGVPAYQYELDTIRPAVRDASRVLLVVHGIIGDTRGLTEYLGIGPDPVAGRYDAVLALDYESINTPVAETARELADRVAALGLADGRRIDVLAHSMGGLVSRWWIEREGGAAAVRRLVTCGTPHLGSPWPRVQDLATAGLALGLNGIGGLAGHVLGSLVAAVERVDDALDDMRPGSAMLAQLAGSTAPAGVEYLAIAGDEPFGPANTGRASRILHKLRLPEAALGLLFDGAPNDLAVSVASASAVGADWPNRPPVLDADCNHLAYFTAGPGGLAVRRALASGV